MHEEEKINGIDKWKVESDLRTCEEHKSIFADSSRLKAVKELASEKIESLSGLAAGKKLGHDKAEDEAYGTPATTHKLN